MSQICFKNVINEETQSEISKIQSTQVLDMERETPESKTDWIQKAGRLPDLNAIRF